MEASCTEVGGYGTINSGASFTIPGFASATADPGAGSAASKPHSAGTARPTVADVLRNHVPAYLRKYPKSLTRHQRYVLQRLMDCRTEALGGHGWKCDWCGHSHYAHESCNNRHCPTCGGRARHLWLEKMLSWSLPTSYFHVIFTLPHEFCGLIRVNPKAIYRLLFQSAQQALLSLGVDRLGATLGALIVLTRGARP